MMQAPVTYAAPQTTMMMPSQPASVSVAPMTTVMQPSSVSVPMSMSAPVYQQQPVYHQPPVESYQPQVMQMQPRQGQVTRVGANATVYVAKERAQVVGHTTAVCMQVHEVAPPQHMVGHTEEHEA